MLSANTTGAMSFDQNIQQAMGAKNARLAVIQMIKQLRIELDIADKEIDVEGVQRRCCINRCSSSGRLAA